MAEALLLALDQGAASTRAIVFDAKGRRTAAAGEALRSAEVAETTGLLVDPYFSATKIAWIRDHVEGARARRQGGP